jgi:hypothetical protein
VIAGVLNDLVGDLAGVPNDLVCLSLACALFAGDAGVGLFSLDAQALIRLLALRDVGSILSVLPRHAAIKVPMKRLLGNRAIVTLGTTTADVSPANRHRPEAQSGVAAPPRALTPP